jgi:hypothetical protein
MRTPFTKIAPESGQRRESAGITDLPSRSPGTLLCPSPDFDDVAEDDEPSKANETRSNMTGSLPHPAQRLQVSAEAPYSPPITLPIHPRRRRRRVLEHGDVNPRCRQSSTGV